MRIIDWSSDVCSSDLADCSCHAVFAWGSNDRPRLRNPAVCTHPSCGRVPHAILRADFRLLSLILPRNPFRLPALYHEQSSRVLADRKSVVKGKSVSVRVDLGGGLTIKKKK